MSADINLNIKPNNGYNFVENDGHIHRGENWKDLVAKVQGYRQVNKVAAGDPWGEITLQHCGSENPPSYCRQKSVRHPVVMGSSNTQSQNRLKEMLVKWFTDLIALKRVNKLPRVDDVTAAKRAEICRRCPKQTGISEVCEPCNRAIRLGRKAILENQNSRHQGIKFCGALGEDTSISCHIEQPKSSDPALPPECWRK